MSSGKMLLIDMRDGASRTIAGVFGIIIDTEPSSSPVKYYNRIFKTVKNNIYVEVSWNILTYDEDEVWLTFSIQAGQKTARKRSFGDGGDMKM